MTTFLNSVGRNDLAGHVRHTDARDDPELACVHASTISPLPSSSLLRECLLRQKLASPFVTVLVFAEPRFHVHCVDAILNVPNIKDGLPKFTGGPGTALVDGTA